MDGLLFVAMILGASLVLVPRSPKMRIRRRPLIVPSLDLVRVFRGR